MSQRKRSVEKTKRKSSLPIDFNNLNFDILNPDHLSKIQGPGYDGHTDVGDSLWLCVVWDVDDRDSTWKSHLRTKCFCHQHVTCYMLKTATFKKVINNFVNNTAVTNSMNVLSVRLTNNPDKFNWVSVVLEPKQKSRYYFINEMGFYFLNLDFDLKSWFSNYDQKSNCNQLWWLQEFELS